MVASGPIEVKKSNKNNIMKKELLEGLTKEQVARIKECKSNEEILKVAKEEGVELTDEQLEAVSGGCGFVDPTNCPKCNSTNFITADINMDGSRVKYFCNSCGCKFEADSDGVRIIG